jgi:pimeloyl-ACP methyl ester carboxylesterase
MQSYTRAGLTFDVRDEGPAGAREPTGTVVLLHGFPQDSTSWADVVPALHEGGLRTLAPDQRGYSPGARPRERSAYRMRELARDVEALLDAAGVERAHVVGHDWGGAAAWAFAGAHPDRTASLTVLSTPHPGALAWSFTHSSQGLRSWYMAAFQLPRLPERLVTRGLADQLAKTGMPREQAEHYAERMGAPGAAAGALGWYRGMAASRADRIGPITVPTTYVWGRRDFALGRAAAQATGRFVAAPYLFVELEAGHWLPETRPGEVARAILARVAG